MMPLVVTQAIVLHAFDYLETSRVLRLITREAGVQSVIAKGARRTRGRVGTGVDLFAEGEAQIYIKPTRDLHTLASFDVTASRAALALEMTRFTAASALAELVLRVASDDSTPELFDSLSRSLDAVALASGAEVVAQALAGAWQLVAEAGFAPVVDECASCHAALDPMQSVAFSASAGGALCESCARRGAVARRLPSAARHALRGWLQGTKGAEGAVIGPLEARAHQRLLREFLRQHVSTDERGMRAFTAWETDFGAPPAPAA
ncbi:MAG: DNA repair protein RecO [Gemmatimonadota bacterium]|nr:DNA repair protein RecO [Gemmatimonadota bacterium]